MSQDGGGHGRSSASRHVLLLVEDDAMADLLVDALLEAGHQVQLGTPLELVRGEIDCDSFHVAIVDLDSWERHGSIAIARLREAAAQITIIALLPCGGLGSDFAGVRYDLALEKPARIHALLAAVRSTGPA